MSVFLNVFKTHLLLNFRRFKNVYLSLEILLLTIKFLEEKKVRITSFKKLNLHTKKKDILTCIFEKNLGL